MIVLKKQALSMALGFADATNCFCDEFNSLSPLKDSAESTPSAAGSATDVKLAS